MKKCYEATVFIIQKGCEKEVIHTGKYRYKWFALMICLLVQMDFTSLVAAGLIDVQTTIIDLENELT